MWLLFSLTQQHRKYRSFRNYRLIFSSQQERKAELCRKCMPFHFLSFGGMKPPGVSLYKMSGTKEEWKRKVLRGADSELLREKPPAWDTLWGDDEVVWGKHEVTEKERRKTQGLPLLFISSPHWPPFSSAFGTEPWVLRDRLFRHILFI